jgi:putative Mg2+ transporter-C (MgtC) family protein
LYNGHVTIDWYGAAVPVIKVAVAYLLAMPIGWERERDAKSLGIRTFPLVAMASCGYVLLGSLFGPASADAQSRIIQGVITGIGFIGGGAILKTQGSVRGTATAASIWNTGVIGTAVALERYEIAVILSVLNLLTLRLMLPLKQRLHPDGDGDETRDI